MKDHIEEVENIQDSEVVVDKELVDDLTELIEARLTVKRNFFSGPLPPPEILEGYDRVSKGSADKIISMAISQSEHRKRMEEKQLFLAGRDSLLGILIAGIIAVIGVFGGIYLIAKAPQSAGAVIGGSIIGGTPMLGIIRTFVLGVRDKKEDKK